MGAEHPASDGPAAGSAARPHSDLKETVMFLSRAGEVERQAEREQDILDEQLESGEISKAQYNREMQDLQRDVRGAFEQDQLDALEQVRNDWGW